MWSANGRKFAECRSWPSGIEKKGSMTENYSGLCPKDTFSVQFEKMSGNNLLPNQFIKVSILLIDQGKQFYCSFASFFFWGGGVAKHLHILVQPTCQMDPYQSGNKQRRQAILSISHILMHINSVGLTKEKNIPMRICYISVRTKVFAFIVEYRHSSTLPQVQLVPKTESTLSTLETVERSAPDDLRDPMSKSEMY